MLASIFLYQYTEIPIVGTIVVSPASTTIKVSRKTLKQLEEFRRKFNARSYDEVVLRLIQEYRKRIIEEYFGVDRGRITSFREEDRGEVREY